MPDASPRRPRFLAAVPETPAARALALTPAPAATAPRPVRAASAPPPPPAERTPEPPRAPEPPRSADRLAPEGGEARRESLQRIATAVDTLRAQAGHLAEQARADALEIGFLVARTLLEAEVRQNP